MTDLIAWVSLLLQLFSLARSGKMRGREDKASEMLRHRIFRLGIFEIETVVYKRRTTKRR